MRRAPPASHLPPNAQFAGGAENFGNAFVHPPPAAPPPSPPVPLADMEVMCASAARDIASEGSFVSYQSVATRVCLSRGVTHLTQLGVSDPTGQLTVLDRIWRAQQLIDSFVVSYVAQRFVTCITDMERDLVDLLYINNFRPSVESEQSNLEEIAIENEDEGDDEEKESNDANAANTQTSFEYFRFGPLIAHPSVRHYFGLNQIRTAESQNGFIDGAVVAKHLASFLRENLHDSKRTGTHFAQYVLDKEQTPSLQWLGIRINAGPVGNGPQVIAAGHVANRLACDTARAADEARVAEATAEKAKRAMKLSERPQPPPRLTEPTDKHARACVVGCQSLLDGPWRPSRGKVAKIVASKYPNINLEILAAATEYVSLHLCGSKVRAQMFEKESDEQEGDGVTGKQSEDEVDDAPKSQDVPKSSSDIPRVATDEQPSSSSDDEGENKSGSPVRKRKRREGGSKSPPLRVQSDGIVVGTHVRTNIHSGEPRLVQNMPFEAISKHTNGDEAVPHENVNKIENHSLHQCAPWWEPCDVSDPRAVGRWGEALVYNFLVASRPGWRVTWLNEQTESTSFYDIHLESPDFNDGSGRRVIFVEVKTTRSRDKNVFEMSPNEWNFANRPGVDYRVFRVFGAGDRQNARLTVVKDPARMVNERGIALCLAI